MAFTVPELPAFPEPPAPLEEGGVTDIRGAPKPNAPMRVPLVGVPRGPLFHPGSTVRELGYESRALWEWTAKQWHALPFVAIHDANQATIDTNRRIEELGKLQHIVNMSLMAQVQAQIKEMRDYVIPHMNLQWRVTQRLNAVQAARIDALETWIGATQNAGGAALKADVVRLQAQVDQQAMHIRQLEHDAARRTDLVPLYENLGKLQTQVNAVPDVAKWVATAVAGAEVARAVGPLQDVVRNLGARLAPLEADAVDCLKPMCDTMGPKSNLGKVLKGLGALLGLGAAAALANLTEKDLERIAHTFAGITSGSLESLFHGFVQGGETVGAAGAPVLGELTSVGASVLHELGIPGL